MLCATPGTTVDVADADYTGDVGAVLQCLSAAGFWTLTGLRLHDRKGATGDQPVAFARVDAFREWINATSAVLGLLILKSLFAI